MKNILITSAGKRGSLISIFKDVLCKCNLDSKVLTTDMNPQMAPACYLSDGFFKVARCTSDGYIPELLNICRENNVGVIIPTIDTELEILSKSKSLFKEIQTEILVSELKFIKICRDKRFTDKFFKTLDIRTPILLDKYRPSFPMFAKPYDGSLSKNLHVIWKEEDLTTDILNDPKLLFMEYIDKQIFKEFTVDMYYGKDHKVKGIVPRERIEVRAGEISKGITRKNFIIDYLLQKMNYLDGVAGCICVQLFYDENSNNIIGIEINPRFGGGIPLSYFAKADFPKYVVEEYLLGKNIEYSENWLDNTLMLRYDKEIIVYDKESDCV